MIHMEYTVIIEPADDGTFSVYVPDLPGCVSTGRTREEAIESIREAIQGQCTTLLDLVQNRAATTIAVSSRRRMRADIRDLSRWSEHTGCGNLLLTHRLRRQGISICLRVHHYVSPRFARRRPAS